MALTKLCLCGAVSVGASLKGNITVTAVYDDGAQSPVEVDSSNNLWLIAGHSWSSQDKIVRCDDSWSCTDWEGGKWEVPELLVIWKLNKNNPHDPRMTTKRAIDTQGNVFSVLPGEQGEFQNVYKKSPQGNGSLVGPNGLTPRPPQIPGHSPSQNRDQNCIPKDIAVDSKGNLYVACSAQDWQAFSERHWIVKKCTPIGDCSDFYTGPTTYIESIAVGPGDFLYTYNQVNAPEGKTMRLTRCSPDSDCENFALPSGRLDAETNFALPSGHLGRPDGAWSLTVDQKGDVYVTTVFSGVFRLGLPSVVTEIQV